MVPDKLIVFFLLIIVTIYTGDEASGGNSISIYLILNTFRLII